jgi:hypothetical protein
MVTAETEAKFAEKGVRLVSAEQGRKLFIDELQRAPAQGAAQVELVFGQGPWEQREAALGELRRVAGEEGLSRGPLLGAASVKVEPKGDQIVSLRLDASHVYLDDHRLDGVRVLPAAGALELFAEAAASLWPDWTLVEVKDCRLMKGIELQGAERALRIVVSPPPYGSSEGFEVTASLQSEPEGGRPALTHYRCVLRFEQQLPESFEVVSQLHVGKRLTVEHAYGQWLFHGPLFQVIDDIDGLSATGARARVRTSKPSEWMGRVDDEQRWLFDPAVVDAAPQMAILWARNQHDQTALPTRFGRVVRYRDEMPAQLHMAYECLPSDDPSQVRANVYYLDADHRVVMLIEELEGVASAALNRLSRGSTLPNPPSGSKTESVS